MSSGIDSRRRVAETGVACILCGQALSSTIDDPRDGDRHEALVCGRHSDEELSTRGLMPLWAGGDTRPGSIHQGETIRLAGTWELGPEGAHAVVLLFDDGDLLIITPEYDGVATVRVPRHQRLLTEPRGLPPHAAHPWGFVATEGTEVSSILRREDGRVEVVLAGRGTVTFSADMASWGELGDGRYLLSETWKP